MSKNIYNRLNQDGHCWMRKAIPMEDVLELRQKVTSDNAYGERVCKHSSLHKALIKTDFHRLILASIPNMRLVRVVGFYKTVQQNWSLPWHQDRVIAVDGKHELKRYKNWTYKAEQWHCEAPLNVLQNMFFCRLYLDDCDPESGAMLASLGSHKAGIVMNEDAESIAQQYPGKTCLAKAGDVLILPMLTLHKSTLVMSDKLRRVIRLDYAAVDLPKPLKWAYAD